MILALLAIGSGIFAEPSGHPAAEPLKIVTSLTTYGAIAREIASPSRVSSRCCETRTSS